MDIKTFVQVVTALPNDISVLAKGPTGIGKSFVAKTFADALELRPLEKKRLLKGAGAETESAGSFHGRPLAVSVFSNLICFQSMCVDYQKK